MIRPLPYPEADQLVAVWPQDRKDKSPFAYGEHYTHARYSSARQRADFFRRLVGRAAEILGVSNAAAVRFLPMSGVACKWSISIPGSSSGNLPAAWGQGIRSLVYAKPLDGIALGIPAAGFLALVLIIGAMAASKAARISPTLAVKSK